MYVRKVRWLQEDTDGEDCDKWNAYITALHLTLCMYNLMKISKSVLLLKLLKFLILFQQINLTFNTVKDK